MDIEFDVNEMYDRIRSCIDCEDKGSMIKRIIESFDRESLPCIIDRVCSMANDVIQNEFGVLKDRVNWLLSTLYYVNHIVCSIHQIQWTPSSSTDDDLVSGMARFSIDNGEDLNRCQQLLVYLLNCAQVKGYRRRHMDIWTKKYIDSIDTHTWYYKCSIRDFVFECTRKELNYDMWLNLTSNRTNIHTVVEHLTHCIDSQFPELHVDRHKFAYRNGIYDARSDKFISYDQVHCNIIAAKYFDIVLSYEEESISTPYFQSILDFQNMSESVCNWMCIMIGRLIYETNDLDSWQVIPFLKGAASSGKSTILSRVCRGLYDPSDVGTMSNNIEKKFGLSALLNKFVFIGPEIKGDMQLEQAEFQSIVSGESIQVAQKMKTAQTIEWKIPGFLAGNEVPSWVDNSGSINRRIILFDFPNSVKNGDMELGKKLDIEMGNILVKCNRAYLNAVTNYAKNNIWNHLPPEFHTAKEDLSENTNSFIHFLKSEKLQYNDDLYIPFETLAESYYTYVISMGLTKIRLTQDKILHPLTEQRCRILKKGTKVYPRDGIRMITSRFVLGCDIVREDSKNMIDF